MILIFPFSWRQFGWWDRGNFQRITKYLLQSMPNQSNEPCHDCLFFSRETSWVLSTQMPQTWLSRTGPPTFGNQ